MAESIHQKLSRVRAPRVHITYDVETGGAPEKKELPFVMGILGDFTGHPAEPLAKLKERKFVEVTPDNFDDVLKSMKPHLRYQVENRLSEEAGAGRIGIDLKFRSLEDFSPDQVAKQVEPLKELLDLRQKLADMRGSLQGNERLDEILQATIHDRNRLDRLQAEVTAEGGSDDAE